MRDDGRDEFKQVSFNQSSDYEPTVLDNGKVLFSRWDHAGNVNGIHLYQMNPDGTELELLYGAESHLTGTNNGAVQFVSAREMLDGRIMAILRPFDHPELGGAITIIDTQTYVENTQPVASSVGHAGARANGGDAEPGAHGPRAVAGRPVQLGVPAVGRHGPRADDVVDLPARGARPRESDRSGGVLYVPCTPERLAATNPEPVVAPPLYGVWMYDPTTQTQLADRDRRRGRAHFRRRGRATAPHADLRFPTSCPASTSTPSSPPRRRASSTFAASTISTAWRASTSRPSRIP